MSRPASASSPEPTDSFGESSVFAEDFSPVWAAVAEPAQDIHSSFDWSLSDAEQATEGYDWSMGEPSASSTPASSETLLADPWGLDDDADLHEDADDRGASAEKDFNHAGGVAWHEPSTDETQPDTPKQPNGRRNEVHNADRDAVGRAHEAPIWEPVSTTPSDENTTAAEAPTAEACTEAIPSEATEQADGFADLAPHDLAADCATDTGHATVEVDEYEVNAALNAVVYNSLLPLTSGICILYLIYVVTDVLLMPAPGGAYLSLMAALSAVAALLLRISLRHVNPYGERVYAVGSLLGVVVLANVVAQVILIPERKLTEDALFLLIGTGFVFMSTRWFVGMTTITLVGWSAVAVFQYPWAELFPYILTLAATTILAIVMHVVRRRTNIKAEKLRLATEHQSTLLADALTTEATHRQSLARSQKALQLAYSDAEESKHRWKSLVHNHPGGVIISVDGNIVFANAASASILGTNDPDWLIGTSYYDFVPPRALLTLKDHWMRTAAGAPTPPYQHELNGLDGTTRVVVTNSVPIVYKGQVAAQTVVQDVTERQQREEDLRIARDEAEEMSRLKSAFLANMSHEIRTPLTSIIGFSEILNEVDERDQVRFTRLIRKSSKRLLDTINSVLDLSKLEAGVLHLAPASIDAAKEVATCVDLLSTKAEQAGLSLTLDATESSIPMLLDRSMLHRILNNLIGNAIKFTPEGGHVAVRVEPMAHRLDLHVVDTGIGIDPSFLPHLFKAFHQESSGIARSHEGSGLGLAITKRLVELMDGSITVRSEKGKGTHFTVRIPRVTA